MNRSSLVMLAGSVLFAMALAGCGSSTSLSTSSTISVSSAQMASSSHSTAVQPPTRSAEKGPRRHPTAPATHRGKTMLRAQVYHPPTTSANGAGSIAAIPSSVQNPCTFVTKAEIAAIAHARVVRRIEAPQGPTCLVELHGQKQSITLAVEAVNVDREIAQMKVRPLRWNIGGHPAYCGRLGSSMLLVKLGGDRVLQIIAPCPQAKALAAKAVPRIKA